MSKKEVDQICTFNIMYYFVQHHSKMKYKIKDRIKTENCKSNLRDFILFYFIF